MGMRKWEWENGNGKMGMRNGNEKMGIGKWE